MISVLDVDPLGDALAGWHAVVAASLQASRPDDVVPPLAETRAAALAGLPERDPSELVTVLLAVDGDHPAGAARVDVPQRDNHHLVYVDLHVAPDSRRRGVGTRLLDEVATRARAMGRTLLTTDLDEPPALAGSSPGRAFLGRHGFECALTEVRRDLAVPVPPGRLATLEERTRPHSAGYRVVTWRHECPDDLVDSRAELGRVMSVDVPLGSLDWQEEAWDAARVREREQVVREQGRALLVAAAVHEETGQLVAFTELAVRPAEPRLVDQWETLVLGPHRGHRLGLLVKVAALRLLAEQYPDARTIATCNADVNAPMIAVNEALGFVPNGASSSWQLSL